MKLELTYPDGAPQALYAVEVEQHDTSWRIVEIGDITHLEVLNKKAITLAKTTPLNCLGKPCCTRIVRFRTDIHNMQEYRRCEV